MSYIKEHWAGESMQVHLYKYTNIFITISLFFDKNFNPWYMYTYLPVATQWIGDIDTVESLLFVRVSVRG